ncbi:MAG: hypothetical protein HFK06_01945 [Clostridia bacterium]|nr:hypothetical protein [Clostridia bacterium]
MPNDKNEIELNGAPKKADIIIKNTQNIASKQEDLSEQTRLAVSRLDEAIELFTRNNQDSAYIVKQSEELFAQLQSENSALKQELLYLAKQSENIYAGLAEKINELSEQAKTREEAMSGFADRINDVAEQTRRSEEAYTLITDKLADIAEQNKRSEEMYSELSGKLAAVKTVGAVERVVPAEVDLTAVLDKLNAVSEQIRRNDAAARGGDMTAVLDKLNVVSEQMRRTERAYADLSDRVSDRPAERTIIREKSDASAADITEVLDKITRLSEQLRRSDSAHSMLADKFEILSMRVEQYAFESNKAPAAYPQSGVTPVVIPAPAPVQTAREEIDYDKLAEKVASLITAREVVSPDYIASKVAEQIVIPETGAPNVNVTVDADYIASRVMEHINLPETVNVDGEEIADKVAQRLNRMNSTEIAASAVDFDEDNFADMLVDRLSVIKTDEDALVERIAEKLDALKGEESAPVRTVDFNEEELAERIARKLEGVKPEEVALDEEALAERIARKVGGYNTNVAPVTANVDLDEEELADAISLKVGSLKAEDFEILVDDEGCLSISKVIADNLDYNTISNIIADKLREALDLAAVNAPDYEEMAERISEKITVAGINEDAIAEKAAAVLSNYLPELDTEEITDKITGAVIDVVSAMPQPTLDSEEICNSISEKLIESQEDHDYDIVVDDDGISKITGLVSEEVTRETGVRFDKVEDDIARLSEAVAKIGEFVEAKDTVETTESAKDDYSGLSEVVAAEIEKGVAARLDNIQDDIAKITEVITAEDEPEEEYAEEDYAEDDYSKLSELVAAEIEKGVSAQLNSVADNVAKITEYLAEVENEEADEEALAEQEPSEYEDIAEDYTELSEVVASEVEKRVSARLDTLEAKITEIFTAEDEPEEYAEEEAEELDYSALSEVVAAELEKNVTARLDTLEEKISGIAEIFADEEVGEETEEEEIAEDYSNLSEAVADEVEKRVTARLDTLEEKISGIAEIFADEEVGEETEEEEVAEDYSNLSEAVADEVEKRVTARLDTLEEKISGIAEIFADEEVGEETEEEEVAEDYSNLSEAVADEVEKRVSARFETLEQNVNRISELMNAEPEEGEDVTVEEYVEEDFTGLSEAVADEVEKRVSYRLEALEEKLGAEPAAEATEDYSNLSEAVASEVEKRVNARLEALEENVSKITEIITAEAEEVTDEAIEEVAEDYTSLSEAVATEVEKRVSYRLDSFEESIANTNERLDGVEENIATVNVRFDSVDDSFAKLSELVRESAATDGASDAVAHTLPVIVAAEIEKGVKDRLDTIEENIAKITHLVTTEEEIAEYEEYEVLDEDDDYAGRISEAVASELEKRVADRLVTLEENVNKLTEMMSSEEVEEPSEETDYTVLSEAVASEVEKRVSYRLDTLEENVNKLTELITAEPEGEESSTEELEVDYTVLSEAVANEVERRVSVRLEALEENVSKITDIITTADEEVSNEESNYAQSPDVADEDYTVLSEAVASEVEKRVSYRLNSVEENIANTNARFESLQENIAKISELVGTNADVKDDDSLSEVKDEVKEIKEMLANGVIVAANEVAAAQAAEVVEEEEQELVTVSDLVPPAPVEPAPDEDDEFEGEEEPDDGEDFLIDVLDMDAFSDDELMPGEISDYSDGVDFANMMKFKRSFISRIIQSSDDNKQYYGEVKHALLSYRKVNSNVAWGAERFNKGRETIARMKIRGKTLCLYLALDPNNYKVSVYHHVDVSDNKSVAGTPMMVKVKSPLGVRKAIRLIDEMLALRNGEKREVPERDYAAMYPYETIEELIEDGLVKDLRNK